MAHRSIFPLLCDEKIISQLVSMVLRRMDREIFIEYFCDCCEI